MAFVRDLVSVLMVCISYQAVVAYPRGAEPSLLQQYRTNGGAATAQSFSKLSTSCQLAAGSLLSGEFGTCADLMGLVSILETKESIISPINTWVTDACSGSPCDQASLAAASRVIRKGCATDLEEQSIAALALYSIITHYDATRDMFCTQHKKDGSFCLPSVLGNVEERSGEKITIAEVVSLISGKITRADLAFLSVSKEAYCTDCAHAIVSQSAAMIDAIKKDPAGIKFEYAHDKHMHQVSDVCGASFEDRALPPTVQIAEPKSA
ncbi:hypothetical protein Pst134EA_000183 [Puccinia striiformis f. sp. tritici]|uniref:Saposin B-type domain-containing protein n=1 Tax=Puccinia striiformis f. sp. tritici PST-78 TaxID=1165861 RepID=A0A0L0UWX1_9BASI|nr:hypothetical protein Pst134EA_000183 [Puccinia striiformis f. sp. tritici]KAH9473103.1 hypothetical protein Pst134EA_000183 [Puccinia striiformis f. sp. tritici]KAI9607561.1 hypothetical protein KEM48_001509 [Puccinia striiformis f. sp. tritici PST-130]KNE91441.1 hypothetical protein PSTG_15137 [Puccinia striiformis f. sp. tritici PST-78]